MADEKKLNEEVEKEVDDAELEKIEEGIVPGLRDTDLSKEVQSSFLDYAMSVIVARAIPDIRDGCKPVHRRVIYDMYISGITPGSPYKKCARIVGDVMGKFHPHGDQAIYSTLVRMAQPFSMRYTLVDGHGNFGSVDGDEPAAYRYTEARMTKLAMEMVRDIKCDTVDFVDNYDGTEQEPSVLPSRFPNLIVNGSNGIAVGMATYIPTHNLGETIDAVVALAKNPNLTPLEIMTNYLYGPDFSTGAIILGRSGIKEAYETGTGSIVIRSRAEIKENEHSGKKQIIISEIPYQVNKANLVTSIAHLVRDKVVEGITDIRDESSKGKVRIVIDVRHDSIPEVVLNQLYKLTQLQTSMGVIMLSLVDGQPKVLPINEILLHYLDFQVNVVERRTKYLLAQDEARLHIVSGLLRATEHIDEIVKDIRAASTPEDALNTLMKKYEFSEVQAQAILAMTLRRLTGLEEGKLEAEKAALLANIEKYNHILSSRENVVEVVVSELLELKEKYSDERMTEISDDAATIEDEDLIPQKDIVIVLTTNNYVKRMTTETFRTQHRGGRGVRGMSTNGEDSVNLMIHTHTHTDVLFFSNLGRVYRLRGYMIPEESRTSKGLPIQNLLNLEKGEKIVSILPLDDYHPEHFLFFATKEGVVKRTALSEFESIRKNGKIAILLKEGDMLLDVKRTNGEALICLASSKGKMVKFNEADVRPIGRTAAGVKGMDLSDGSSVIGLTTSLEGENILVVTLYGYGKMSPLDDYRESHRGTKGVITLNVTSKNGRIVAMRAVKGDEDLMMITNGGTVIRMPLEQIKIVGRNTQGVKVIRLDDEKQRVSSITIIPHEDISGEEEVAKSDNEEVTEEAKTPAENE
ncbi:MAG: DNA gyrase subunit A [Bacilli bacterium]|nr:DNA gyrase subunit A [Erysipelotrichaceae bacterium]MDY4818970.1 DNA gyrase subunit A [Bacilli bacterium]